MQHRSVLKSLIQRGHTRALHKAHLSISVTKVSLFLVLAHSLSKPCAVRGTVDSDKLIPFNRHSHVTNSGSVGAVTFGGAGGSAATLGGAGGSAATL